MKKLHFRGKMIVQKKSPGRNASYSVWKHKKGLNNLVNTTGNSKSLLKREASGVEGKTEQEN